MSFRRILFRQLQSRTAALMTLRHAPGSKIYTIMRILDKFIPNETQTLHFLFSESEGSSVFGSGRMSRYDYLEFVEVFSAFSPK